MMTQIEAEQPRMTALSEFDRLEATGLWRADTMAQRREVIVSLGHATLMLKDTSDRALTHWSLAAVERLNPGKLPAIYHPDGDSDEVLELGVDAQEMVDAIEKLRKAVARSRPSQGRLRFALSSLVLGGVVALSVFWLPGALREHTLRVVPEVKRDAIGLSLIDEISRLTGPPCRASASAPALRMLARRVLGEPRAADVIVLRGSGAPPSTHLPGGFVLLSRAVMEDSTSPESAAGFVLSEEVRAQARDPLEQLLKHAGFWATARLLTTGHLPQSAIEGYAPELLQAAPPPVLVDAMAQAFETAEISLRSYAYAVDITGESVVSLIEADRLKGQDTRPVMADNDWLRLQAICE